MSKKPSRKPEMISAGVSSVTTTAIEAKSGLIDLCGQRRWFETKQRWLENGARKAGISFRMAKAIIYDEVVDPKSSVLEKIRAAVRKQEEAARAEEAEARAERQELLDRISRLESRLNQTDPDFYVSETDGLRQGLYLARGDYRSA